MDLFWENFWWVMMVVVLVRWRLRCLVFVLVACCKALCLAGGVGDGVVVVVCRFKNKCVIQSFS